MIWGAAPSLDRPSLRPFTLRSVRRSARRPLAGLAFAAALVLLIASTGQAGILDLAWDAPTTNADATPLTDLSGYNVYFATVSLLTSCPPGTAPQFVASSTPAPTPGTVVTHQLTGLTTGTLYFVRVTAVDFSGNQSVCSNEVNAAALPDLDTTPPTVSMTAPANGATARGTVTVSATAADNVGVVGVQFRLDGAPLGAEDLTAPYGVSWNTTTASNGAHTLTAVARDAAGNTTTSSGVTVTVDNSAPIVTLTAPSSGATVSGTITVSATASDNVGVVGVQFRLDGANLGAEDTTSPYSVSWTTTTASDGSHTLTAIARDAAGNTTTSSSVSVTVANGDTTAPTVAISAPASGAAVAGTITVAATASDNVGVVGVQFRMDGTNLGAEDTTSPYSVSWSTTTATNGSHTLTAIARDAAGNATTSSGVTVTVDNSAPTAAISAPASGATVAGTITVSATASDNVGVVGVQFRLDGANLGAEDTTSPYSLSWDTTTAGNGPHTLTAVARDAAGNTTTSGGVPVTVSNVSPPPLNITTTSLPAGTVGTAYSQTLGATGGTTPYTWSLATGTLPAGLSLNGAVLSGTPPTAATSNFTVRVTDSLGATDTQALSLTVNAPAPLNITTTSLPGGTVGASYGQTLTATGGVTPYTWSLSSGTLPPGLSLSAGGVLGSSPTTAGTYTFTVQVTDGLGTTATRVLSLTVSATPAPAAATAGGAGCFIATAAYGSPMEPQVVLLRAFRDRYLLAHTPGQVFVQWYYRASPPLAARINQSASLRALVRGLLWPLVGIAWITLHPGVGGGVLVGATLTAGWLWDRRRKVRRRCR